jgi:uncharacterized phage protein (TIGR01671 family)
MRTIKFRAWNLATKKMLVPHAIENPIDDPLGGNTGTIYQQFTGLFDKNGKEIYEGDIVEWQHSWSRPGAGSSRMVVEWVKDEIGGQYKTIPYINETTEVIGNIYENPALLS